MLMFKNLYTNILHKTTRVLRKLREPNVVIVGSFGPEIPLFYHDKVPKAQSNLMPGEH